MKSRSIDIYDKSNKAYEKALSLYNNGQLEKALEICDKEGERVLYNPSFLNLKGLLYYLKGEMNEARKCWNLNYVNSKDPIAEKYLLDSKNDEELWKLYIKGLKHEKSLNVNEAIYALEKCKCRSDFNSINVNNALCKCYMEKSNYNESISCMEKVLSMDSKNKTALQYKKTLMDLGVLRRDKIKRIVSSSLMAGCIIVILILCISVTKTVYNGFMSKKNNVNAKSTIDTSKESNKGNKTDDDINSENINKLEEQIKKIEQEKDKEKENKTQGEKETVKFPTKDIENYIKDKKYMELHNQLNKWESKKKELSTNEIALFNKAHNFMNNYAGQYFYNLGRNSSKSGNFNKAIEYYNIGIRYGVGRFPYEDNLYMLGVCYNKINDTENSIKIFERYYKEYKDKKYIKDGSYIEDVLRYLVSMYKNLNDDKYKIYEKELK